MKKVIDWKLYDTDKSDLVCSIWNWFSCSGFRYFKETLYKSKKWQYFLLKEWWPLSKYSYTEWTNKYGDSDIEIINFEELLKWFEENYKYFWKTSIDDFLKEFWENIVEW